MKFWGLTSDIRWEYIIVCEEHTASVFGAAGMWHEPSYIVSYHIRIQDTLLCSIIFREEVSIKSHFERIRPVVYRLNTRLLYIVH
jgi:hypothetical protein